MGSCPTVCSKIAPRKHHLAGLPIPLKRRGPLSGRIERANSFDAGVHGLPAALALVGFFLFRSSTLPVGAFRTLLETVCTLG